MHRSLSSRWLRTALRITGKRPVAEVFIFLCPVLGQTRPLRHGQNFSLRSPHQLQRLQCLHTQHEVVEDAPITSPSTVIPKSLPIQCSGCGAFSQTSSAEEPGYYDLDRKAVKIYLGQIKRKKNLSEFRKENALIEAALKKLDPQELENFHISPELLLPHGNTENSTENSTENTDPQLGAEDAGPLCDRCHRLIHHNVGVSIYHPTVETLRETIQESPFKHNHIYHIIDAADFPMSLVTNIDRLLADVSTLRSKNRRARQDTYVRGRKYTLHFIITRSDLVAPKKEQVDRLMPYFREVLREALGRSGKMVRLGNVKLVSAHRGWWTRSLKEEIAEHGGASWMVGKVNVGKSQLFSTIFPKGSNEPQASTHDIPDVKTFPHEPPTSLSKQAEPAESTLDNDGILDVHSLLPPARTAANYPAMPTVSALPGTTASPIRIPFGRGKGELIDMPGLSRGDIEHFVQPEHRNSLIMQHRIVPDQQVVKPGQSVILGGGLIRITPQTSDLVFLAYSFTNIKPHLTSTEKAIGFQEQSRPETVENICVPGTGDQIRHAGSFQLKYDVTKRRAGPITSKHGPNISVDRLRYCVVAIDILIESVGWVEVVAQVSKQRLFTPISTGQEDATEPLTEAPSEETDAWTKMEAAARGGAPPNPKPIETRVEDIPAPEPNWPVVDVYTPQGRFVSSRQPMNAWMDNKAPKSSHKRPTNWKLRDEIKKTRKEGARTQSA
jgi:genetic interactor of prohibitins 3, mitochondrial